MDGARIGLEEKLSAERGASLKLKGENGILKKKFGTLMREIETGRDTLKSMLEKQVRGRESIYICVYTGKCHPLVQKPTISLPTFVN